MKGKREKTNEMEIKAFYQQKCSVVFLRELLIFDEVAFLFIFVSVVSVVRVGSSWQSA